MTPLELSMASLPISGDDPIADLIAVLDAQGKVYDDLHAVAQARFVALAASDIEALGVLVGREQPLVTSLRRLESTRMMVVRPIASELGVDAELLTVSQICEAIEEPEASALSTARDHLTATVARVQEANERNRILLQGCLDSATDLAQTLLQAIEMSPQYGALGGSGQSGTGDPPRLADLRA